MDSTARDRCRGALIGNVVGDALGRPFEGAEAGGTRRLSEAIAARISRPSAWHHSDDAQMMLALARSLVERGQVDKEHVLAALADAYEPARGYGRGARRAFEVHAAGGDSSAAGRATWPEGSKGNGGAVRVSPVSVWLRLSPTDDVAASAEESARATHLHEDATSGAAVVAVAIHTALRTGTPPTRDTLEALERHASARLKAQLARARGLRGAKLGRAARALGCGVLATEAVPAALWACAEGGAFEQQVLRAISMGGDTDSVGAIAGALAGASGGAAAIPRAWIAALEQGVIEAIDRFIDSAQKNWSKPM